MKELRILAALALAAALGGTAARADEPTLAWSDLHDGGADLDDDGMSVLFDAEGHVISGGVHDPGAGYTDLLVRKLHRDTGEPLWTFTHTDPIGNDMALSELVLDHRGDVLVAGYLSACDG